MAAHSHQHSDGGKKKRAPHGRRAQVEGKLLVTSRKRQKRQQLVQSVIVGFTMVVKPVESAIMQYRRQHGECEPDSSTWGQTGSATSSWPSSATTRRRWRCCEAEEDRAGRYELQHEVQYGERPGEPSSRRWLSATEFEELLDAHKIEGDLGTGDGV
ncbi:hypothetical protein PR002_g23373 [Phytophthora rubi]|uniref:Uncharacterized protein n=1 Tax=Phytophthora rubi TaxID=129364 RepID=A0A6A3IQH4_9STRA|nr:hypothetical protein PR002_g23373 [Phytophthora rubi]